MGQATDLLASSPEFAPLRQKPDFGAIQTGMKENQSAVSLGTLVFRLSDPTLIPEDLDYDPNTKRFFITTVRGKKIITTDLAGTITEFAKAPDDWPLLAIKIDPRHGVLWASEVALTGFVFVPKADWGKSVVLGYDLKTGKLLHRMEGPHDSALGDMALTPDGDVIVSDGDGGGVYLIHAGGEGLERLDGGDFISPQTPAVPSDGKKIFVPDYLRGIGMLDIAAKQVRWLNMEGRFALNGIDGLYLEGQTLLAVQNGTSPERVVAFQLDPTFSKVVSETIIERSTETLGDPTHGVIIGNDFYYIANSGWDVIDDQGNPKPGTHPSEALIMRVPLSAFQNR
jgi:sugar lactone lactonase YvrE